MNTDFSPDLITLLDDDGREHNFEILDSVEIDDRLYYALLPVYNDKADIIMDSGEYTILEAVDEDDEQILLEVDNDELRRRLSCIFEDRFNDMFYN